MTQKELSKDVLIAFGTDPDLQLQPMRGGSLVCYKAGPDIIFRPSEDDQESAEIAQAMIKLANIMKSPAKYRISRPIPLATDASTFVHRGWTAWSFVTGSPRDALPFSEILRTSEAFHHDLGRLEIGKPEFISKRVSKFRASDAVAWGDKTLDDFPCLADPPLWARIEQPLRRLDSLKRALDAQMPCQLVHGDIGGNILYEEDEQPPGIIDLTFYWRPAPLASAIVVADGLLHHGKGRELVELYGTDGDRIQILVRALLFRIVAWAIDIPVVTRESDAAWRRTVLPQIDFDGAVDVVEHFVTSA